jgi:MFS family permease
MPRLPRSAWLVLAGDALSAAGSGLTIPFAVIYLHSVRGVPLAAAAACVSVLALTGFVGNPLGGWLSDHSGPKVAVSVGLVLSAAGSVAIAMVHSTGQAFAAFALFGMGACIATPAQDALLAVIVEPEQRSSAFSIRHGTFNAGLAVGGLAAAVVVKDGDAGRFVTLYLIDAVTFLAFVPALAFVRLVGTEADGPEPDEERVGGVRLVLRDPVFRRVWLLTAGLFAFGYAQFNTAFPAFMGRPGGIRTGHVGIVFAANTVVIVLLQLPVLRLLSGRLRSASLALTCACWAAAWALTLGAGVAGSSGVAVAGFIAAALVFGLGETFLSPALGPIVNDLAPDHLRGRYNGLNTLALTTGTVIGPLLGGALLGVGWEGPLFIGLAAACIGLAAFAQRLGRHLPAAANRIGPDEGAAGIGADGAVAAVLGEGV